MTTGSSNTPSISQWDKDFIECIKGIALHPAVRSMENFIQHGRTNCYDHSLYVAYLSYMQCRRAGLDWRSAARGGMLHDFFLYDRRINKPENTFHGTLHPKVALRNAQKYFSINAMEKDIIEKHMWPFSRVAPLYRETMVVMGVDKYCAFMEGSLLGRLHQVRRLRKLLHLLH